MAVITAMQPRCCREKQKMILQKKKTNLNSPTALPAFMMIWAGDDAIRNYLIAIRLGENRKEYFAARAALQIGQIYEKGGQKALAIAILPEMH
jgi:hypothetical protein